MSDLERIHLSRQGLSRRSGAGAPLSGAQEFWGPRAYLRFLLRHKWLILTATLLVVGTVALEVYTMTPLFVSSVNLQIEPESVQVLPYRDIYDVSIPAESFLQTQVQILKGRELARRVIQRLKLVDDQTFNAHPSKGVLRESLASLADLGRSLLDFGAQEEAGGEDEEMALERSIDRLLGDLSTRVLPSTNLVEVSYTSADPRFGARLVNTLAEEFIELNFQGRFQMTMDATEFLKSHLVDLKNMVEQSEAALINYARSKNILNTDEKQNIVSQALAELNRELTLVEAKLAFQTAYYQSLRTADVERFPQVLESDLIRSLESRLYQLEQRLANFSYLYGPNWPETVQIRDEVQKVREQLRAEKQQALDQARADYEVALQHYQLLAQKLEEQKRRSNQLNQDLIQYSILKHEAETNKQLYDSLLQRLKEATLAAGLNSNNIRVAERARVPLSPSSPKKAQYFTFALALGLLLGIGGAVFVEAFDDTLKTPEEVRQYLFLPSLGLVPKLQLALPGGESQVLSLQPHRLGRSSSLPLLAPGSPGWEAYRSLRTSLLLSRSGKPPRTILVTSSLAGEGKSLTALHTAVVLSQTGANTLLVDLDMRNPQLSRLFGEEKGQGASLYLSGQADLHTQIHPTVLPNFYLLPAGPTPPNPTELLGSSRMEFALKLLDELFEFIVIDSSPLLSFSDPAVLTRCVDGVMLVVKGGATGRGVVRRAVQRLEEVGAPVLGVVLNGVDLKDPEYEFLYPEVRSAGARRQAVA